MAKSTILTSFMLKCPTLEVLSPVNLCKSLAVSCENEDSEQQKYILIYQESKAIKLILKQGCDPSSSKKVEDELPHIHNVRFEMEFITIIPQTK